MSASLVMPPTTMHRDHVRMLLTMGQVPTEHDEQCALFEWCAEASRERPELAYLVAVPNFFGHVGSKGARFNAAKRANAEGRKKGYPDILLDVARGGFHGFRGEVKRRKGGRLDPEQAEWLAWLTKQGYFAIAAPGWEAMRDTLLAYLDTEKR